MKNRKWLKLKRIIYEIKINNIENSFFYYYNIFIRNINIFDLVDYVSFEEMFWKTDEVIFYL